MKARIIKSCRKSIEIEKGKRHRTFAWERYMGHYLIIVKKTALKDLSKHKRSGNKKNLINIYRIIKELKIHPYTGTSIP